MDIDLNEEEPMGLGRNDTDRGSGSARYTEPEATHEVIIDRMRRLEAVMCRVTERRRWRESAACSANNVGSTSFTGGMKTGGKRDSSHLVAKALGIDPCLRNRRKGGYYGCNVCLDMARDPVLTCCGHLFCWPCFFKLPYIEVDARECPVCRGEVKDTSIIPIYGSENSGGSHRTESAVDGIEVPPRPHAQRLQSMRQQIYSSREELSFESVQQHLTSIIGIMDMRSQQVPALDAVEIPGPRGNMLGNQVYSSHHQPSHFRVSRGLGLGIEPYSSISLALNDSISVGGLIEDTHADVQGHQYFRGSQETMRINDGDSFLGIAATVQSENRTQSPSSRRNGVVSSMDETIDAPNFNYNHNIPLLLPALSSRRRRTRRTTSSASNGDMNSSTS